MVIVFHLSKLPQQCNSSPQDQKRELQYSSSSESATSDMIYFKSSDEDNDEDDDYVSDLSNGDQTKRFLGNMAPTSIKEV